MAKNRKAFIDSVKKDLNAIDPGNKSIDIMVSAIEKMSAKEFEDYIERLRNGVLDRPDLNKPRELLSIVVPNLKSTKITVKRNIELAEKWGWPIMQRAYLIDPVTKQRYLTNRRYVALELPVFRQAQTLEHKMAIGKSDVLLDSRTGSAAKTVAASALSSPGGTSITITRTPCCRDRDDEIQRGDDAAYREMMRSLKETGHFRMDVYRNNTRAKSSDAVNIYLKAQHLDTNA